MPQAELRQQHIYRPDLKASTAAGSVQGRGVNVILPVGNQEGQRHKAGHNRLASFWPPNSLQKFLKNDSSGEHQSLALQCPSQGIHLATGRRRVSPQRQRPYAGVDEQVHFLDRSDL